VLLSDIAVALSLPLNGSDCEISGMNALRHADANELSFAMGKNHQDDLSASKAGAFLVDQTLVASVPANASYITCNDVSIAMAQATRLFAPAVMETTLPDAVIDAGAQVDPRAFVEKGAHVAKGAIIMAGAYIGYNVTIGEGSVIYPNVTVYRDCHIGANCIIHAGCVIGADGFGFSHTRSGEHVKIYQNGNVVIEDDVELGANCAIDRAVFGSTRIKRGVKFDNFIHIAHNCEIGEYSLFVAQSGVGGSTKFGRNCVVSGQSAFTDHLDIGPFNTFTARSGVTKSIHESHKVFSGYPLMEHRAWRRLQSRIAKLLD